MKIKLDKNKIDLKSNEEDYKKNIEIMEYSKKVKDIIGVNQYEEALSDNNELKINLEKQNINLKNEIKKENERLDNLIKDKNITELYSMVVNLNKIKENPKFSDKNNLKNMYPRRTKTQNLKFVKNMSNINPKYYSTDNSINKVNFNINSPIYMELQRILNNSTLDENTQIKIEKFLNNQGKLILKEKLEDVSDINYHKLNPYLLDVFKKI
jgi:hypothetical protein